MKHLISFLLICISMNLPAQELDSSKFDQGYQQVGDSTIFLFDADHYSLSNAEGISVTGSFRNWSDDLSETKWQLTQQSDKLAVLMVSNPNYEMIPVGSSFKFRTSNGDWLEPPIDAPNSKGGNLEFAFDLEPKKFKVEMLQNGHISLSQSGFERSLDPKDYLLTDHDGKELQISQIIPQDSQQDTLIAADFINPSKVYFVGIPNENLRRWANFDGWFRHLFSSKKMGAEIQNEQTTFRLFAPRATQVTLFLYDLPKAKEAIASIQMFKDLDGVWEAIVQKDLKGTWYDFKVEGSDGPGNHFFETTSSHISDPYARVQDEAHGRSAVWTKTTPATPLKNGIPPMESLIAYEVHVQDFTDALPVSDDLKGTIPAFHKSGLTNSSGQPIGFDHLKNLGINAVHLMPVQEFLHYDDDEWQASFANDPLMNDMGIALENYQWGYRTTHAFAVENKYRGEASKLNHPGQVREQFRDLVESFHRENMAVIIDIVPNHTGENMDADQLNLNFNGADMLYYYRTRDFKHIGAFGNEVKTEDRPMVQKWLFDQCKHWIEEFGIDGFRIDLAGQIDKQTLTKLRKELGDDIIIYGEPWIGSNDPNFEENPDWDWYKEDAPITFFQDDARDAFKGSPFNIKDRGFAGGDGFAKSSLKEALSSRLSTDKTPLSGINYLDIHDNWALADRFASFNHMGLNGVDENAYKLAATLLMTSLGPVVLHGGVEMMRSKGLAPIEKSIKGTKSGMKVHLKGRSDTYNLRKPNQFLWETLGRNQRNGAKCNFKEMTTFWKGLIDFRLSEKGKVFHQSETPQNDYYQFFENADDRQLGYLVGNEVLVLINASPKTAKFSIELPDGSWKKIGDIQRVDLKGISREKIWGGNSKRPVEAVGMEIWIKE